MVRTIPNQLSTTITDEEPSWMSGVFGVGMNAVLEPTMQSACLINECEVSMLRIGFSHGSTSHGKRRPGRLCRDRVTLLGLVWPIAHCTDRDRGVPPFVRGSSSEN